MTSQAPDRTHPEPNDRDERRIWAFAQNIELIDIMDLEPDTVRALLDFDPLEDELTEEPAAVTRPD